MENSKDLRFQPYARLLTMLGDQLIKNERIALIELIKNAYDADSSWVRVAFVGFDKEFRTNSASKIIIEDDGHGMSADIIENHWVKPATPKKKRQKAKNAKTPKGRVMQGEKGIGRFAVLKLGRKIKIITRKAGENVEHVVDFDFSRYDDEFLSEEGEEKAIFLDQLKVSLQTSAKEIDNLISQIEKRKMPVLIYKELPDSSIIEHLNGISFLLLDWKLEDIAESAIDGIRMPDTLSQDAIDQNISFLQKLREACFIPVFIFTNEDKDTVIDILKEHSLYQEDKPNYIFVESKRELTGRVRLFRKIEGWIQKNPSIYVLKAWEREYQRAKTMLYTKE